MVITTKEVAWTVEEKEEETGSGKEVRGVERKQLDGTGKAEPLAFVHQGP